MRRTALALAALLALSPLAVPAQGAPDAAGIETVIRSQVEAMRADDWARAFTFASPTIQGIFRDPETFSRMVTSGYPMVWKPRSVRAGALTETPRGLSQAMIFEDAEGRFFIADYLMIEVGGEWRINGVSIRPAPAESA
ncbi:MAG: DUF4864 domain-containing protein [Paracoccaceae bacterium]